ncbi:hypothetical protein [Actinomycetospora cinnamomea]|uniref:Uncharacterized protein n=1 Tax=Actinomycetospora cinnamomea TaxID=663609 RepID=A0A2U1FIV4_9PSEU|nr:hypothetical protein [Actinomycetospora cinnamomea]PVZ12106.1 hypothetical protein C8D89_103437 [Actinomycetospora cinnamomea]
MTGAPVVVHLRRPEELLAVEPPTLDDDAAARTVPGVDELLDEMLARRRVPRRDRVVLTLPAEAIGPDPAATEARLVTALRHWARRRLVRTEREAAVLWRQGLASLRPGVPLFLVGLLLSTDFLAPDVPEFFQNLLGNGVFLVVAWVGLWYPLDLLFFARLPLRRQHRALDALLVMPVELQVGDAVGRTGGSAPRSE